jgi:hypothetical protein
MADSALFRLTRGLRQEVIPPYQRQSLLSLLPSENIGGIELKTWASKVLKKMTRPVTLQAGSEWAPSEDKMDFEDFNFAIYNFQKRITFTRSEYALFEKHGVLPVGMMEIGSQMAQEANYKLFRGKRADDQFAITQYNYVIDKGTGTNTTNYNRPDIITEATKGHWKDDAGNRQRDIAALVGNLEKYGYNPATSIMFYPEVASAVMREPYVTGSSVYGDDSTLTYALRQGIRGAIPVKDELLYTAAGANPTAALFDLYLIDMSQVLVGYTVPENLEVIYDPVSKNTYMDVEMSFCPLFIPRKADDSNEYIRKGVSRITAIDTTS